MYPFLKFPITIHFPRIIPVVKGNIGEGKGSRFEWIGNRMKWCKTFFFNSVFRFSFASGTDKDRPVSF